jgi:hypothetical protein
MYNLRYHLASLVAVFLALAVGLLLGTVVVERGSIEQQRQSLVTSLQSDFAKLRTTNDSLKRQLGRNESFVDETVPVLSSGRLTGKTTLVIIDSGRTDGLASVSAAVRKAGGRQATARFATSGLGLGDAGVASAAASVLGIAPTAPDLTERTEQALAAEWTSTAAGRPVTDALTKAGALTLDGLDSGRSVDSVALMAISDGVPDKDAVALAAQLRTSGARVVAVETTGLDTGLASAAVDDGLSAVDDVDEAIGAYSLVMVLSGQAEGHYGIKSGADAVFPPVSVPSAIQGH